MESTLSVSASTSSLVGALPPPTPLMKTIFVVFGASGDLAKRKTFPALYHLLKFGFLCPTSILLGFSRSPMNDQSFFMQITSFIKDEDDPMTLEKFKTMIRYVPGDYNAPASHQVLKDKILELSNSSPEFNSPYNFQSLIPVIFYLAVPPSVFLDVARCIHENIIPEIEKNAKFPVSFRIVVEKPFGRDLHSSNQLSKGLAKLFDEHQLYRIDHYLGKEMVKNILVLRFTNRLLETVWNAENIANVQITFKETQGVEGRGGYFDAYGIIRDVMQNHLLQILSLLTMERPHSFSADHIRDSKVAVLKAVRPVDPVRVILGQYVRAGEFSGYQEDPTVPSNSTTCTFAALAMYIDLPMWQNVPFILKCGKGLNEQKAEIRIQFKELDPKVPRNELVIRVQPKEAVYLKLNIKNPGLTIPMISVHSPTPSQFSGSSSPGDNAVPHQCTPTDPFITGELDLTYGDRFTDARIPDAYESLLLDLLHGEQGNFVRDDELDAAWRIFTPLLEQVEVPSRPPIPYKFGSRGPVEADELIRNLGYKREDGYIWRPPKL